MRERNAEEATKAHNEAFARHQSAIAKRLGREEVRTEAEKVTEALEVAMKLAGDGSMISQLERSAAGDDAMITTSGTSAGSSVVVHSDHAALSVIRRGRPSVETAARVLIGESFIYAGRSGWVSCSLCGKATFSSDIQKRWDGGAPFSRACFRQVPTVLLSLQLILTTGDVMSRLVDV